MKLSDYTIQVLKNFSQINKSIKVKPGKVLEVWSESKALASSAQISDEFTSDFAIKDLSKLLGVLSMFGNDYDIKFGKRSAIIKQGKIKVTFTYAEPETFNYLANGIPEYEVLYEFTLLKENLVSLLKAASVLVTPEIAIVGADGNLSIQAIDSKNPTSNLYSLVVGETEDEFSIFIKTENMKFITDGYNVKVSERSTRFTADTITYLVANELNSST